MNPEQARKLVAETFPASFDKARFLYFVRNVVNKIDETKAQAWNTQYVKDAFKPHVQRFERLGTYTDPDGAKLDVLVVHLTADTKLERARTAIRNFVADHLKQRDNKDAALVAFVSPTEQQWRFSYIKMEYQAVETSTGKVGVETQLTPARRFSYIVGEGESCHTAQARFLPLLQDTATNPTLAQIEEAFSVEAVTKEFFGLYCGLFEDINAALEKLAAKDKAVAKEFKDQGVKTVDFAKKLMGQIVFLYFLQKKGWLGVEKGKPWGTGPHDFLRRLAQGKYRKFDNFFNDVLEPLFYDTLATDRGHEAWCNIFGCRIPFLNGGLFEALGGYDWKHVDIELPNKLFFNDEYVEHGVKGTGVLDVFDRYNFTVNEAEPLEKEVAIDPEMLGKVFENLIEENRRKGQGAYYTPREIVHYMCQQSLINYLDTALNAKHEPMVPEDPKQGNLFGDPKARQKAMQAPDTGVLVPRADIETFIYLGEQISHYEAVGTRYTGREMPQSVRDNAREIDAKLAAITVCDPAVGSGAFPVGMMTEIVRMRSALTPYFTVEDVRTPYYFKRHAIQNSLYGVDIDPGAVEIAKLRLWLSLVVDEEEADVIKPLPNLDFKIVTGNSLLGFNYKSERLDAIEVLKERYFRETETAKKSALRAQIDETLKKCFAASRTSLGYHVDFDFEINFSEVFHQRKGFDVVIGNPPWGQKAIATSPEDRKHITKNFPSCAGIFDLFRPFVEKGIRLLPTSGAFAMILPDIVLLKDYPSTRRFILEQLALNAIDWWGMAFDSAVIDTTTLVGTRRRVNGTHEVTVTVHDPDDFLQHSVPQQSFWENPRFVFNLHLTPDKRQILSRLEKYPKVGEYFEIHEGVHSGNIRSQLFVDGQVDDTCRPLLFGRDEIGPYNLTWKGKYIRLSAAPAKRTKQSYANLGRPEWYAAPKLLVRRTGDYVLAAKDSDGRYASNNFFVVFPKRHHPLNLDGLCALLNAPLLTWYFRTIEPRKGRVFAELKIKHLEAFPLPDPTDEAGCNRLNQLGVLQSSFAENGTRHRARSGGSTTSQDLDNQVHAASLALFQLADLTNIVRNE